MASGGLQVGSLQGAVLWAGGVEPVLLCLCWAQRDGLQGEKQDPGPRVSWECSGVVHGREFLGSWGEDPSPPVVLQASRKAGTRGKAAATKQAQRGSSNVFSMFEQAQIQEFKEVSAPLPLAWAPSGDHAPSTSLLPRRSGVLAPVLAPPTTQDPLTSCLAWGVGCSRWRLWPLHLTGLQLHRPEP